MGQDRWTDTEAMPINLRDSETALTTAVADRHAHRAPSDAAGGIDRGHRARHPRRQPHMTTPRNGARSQRRLRPYVPIDNGRCRPPRLQVTREQKSQQMMRAAR